LTIDEDLEVHVCYTVYRQTADKVAPMYEVTETALCADGSHEIQIATGNNYASLRNLLLAAGTLIEWRKGERVPLQNGQSVRY
jgi:hypothetical protein